MFRVPNLATRLVEKTGLIIPPWNSFFQGFTQNPPAVQNIVATGSPFSLTQNDMGNFIISGSTGVSDIRIIRGGVEILIANTASPPVIVPVALGDTLQITYTVRPTIQFLPTWGNSR